MKDRRSYGGRLDFKLGGGEERRKEENIKNRREDRVRVHLHISAHSKLIKNSSSEHQFVS